MRKSANKQLFQVQHGQPHGRGDEEQGQARRVVGARRVQAVVQGRADLQGSGHYRVHSQEGLSEMYPTLIGKIY